MLNVISRVLIGVGITGILLLSIYIRVSKKWDIDAYRYGILATILLSLCSLMIIFSDNVMYMIIDGLFLSSMFYNFTSWFAIKKLHVEEDETKFKSYYCGLIFVGAFIQIFILGLEGSMILRLAVSPDAIALYGQEIFDSLVEAYRSNVCDYYYLLVIQLVVGAIIAYFALRMFAYGAKNHVLKTTMKGEFLMAVFYIVNVFSPHNRQEALILVVVYLAVLLASFMMYRNSKNDRPTIEVVIR